MFHTVINDSWTETLTAQLDGEKQNWDEIGSLDGSEGLNEMRKWKMVKTYREANVLDQVWKQRKSDYYSHLDEDLDKSEVQQKIWTDVN